MAKRFLIQFGVVCMSLGSLMFVGHSILGIMVDVLQGVLYIASGLFAFAAVMQGGQAMRRYLLVFGLVYAIVFFTGVINDGFVLRLFRVETVETIIHLVFASALLAVSAKDQVLARWLAAARRVA